MPLIRTQHLVVIYLPGVIKHVGATNNSISFSDTNIITLNTDDRIDFTKGSIILKSCQMGLILVLDS